jgi:hypothetical protein
MQRYQVTTKHNGVVMFDATDREAARVYACHLPGAILRTLRRALIR